MLFARHHWSLYLIATKLHILELLHEIRPPPTSNLFIYLLLIIQFTHLIYSHESLKTYFFTSNIKWYFIQNLMFNSQQYFQYFDLINVQYVKISYFKALHIIQHVHKRALKLILIIKLHHDFFKVINLIRPEKKS